MRPSYTPAARPCHISHPCSNSRACALACSLAQAGPFVASVVAPVLYLTLFGTLQPGNAGEHHEGIISVARRVFNATSLGPPFWLNRTVPTYCNGSSSPTVGGVTEVQRSSRTSRGSSSNVWHEA